MYNYITGLTDPRVRMAQQRIKITKPRSCCPPLFKRGRMPKAGLFMAQGWGVELVNRARVVVSSALFIAMNHEPEIPRLFKRGMGLTGEVVPAMESVLASDSQSAAAAKCTRACPAVDRKLLRSPTARALALAKRSATAHKRAVASERRNQHRRDAS